METILAIVLVGVALVIGFSVQSARSNSLIQQWASSNGYTLVRAESRALARGPFLLTTNKDQTVYYVTVRDGEGATRRGWVRCGSYWAGLLSDRVEVRWDD